MPHQLSLTLPLYIMGDGTLAEQQDRPPQVESNNKWIRVSHVELSTGLFSHFAVPILLSPSVIPPVATAAPNRRLFSNPTSRFNPKMEGQ